jgi:uncharacterized protein YgiM (DUF1202 family)
MASGTAQVKASSGLNVRKGAGTQYSKIGWLSNGTKISYQAEQNGWLKFNYNGKNGYVSKQYTSITSASTGGNTSSGTTASNGSLKITASTLNVRKGAGTNYDVLGTLSKNQVVSYSGESNGWYKISYKGQVGWISGKYATKTSSSGNTNSGNTGSTTTTTTTMYVTCDTLNVRKGAGTGYTVIGNVKKGTAVAVRKTSNGWHQINYGSGTGWVSGKYVSKTKPSTGSNSGNTHVSAKAQKAIDFAKANVGSYNWKRNGMTYCQGFVADATAKAIGTRYSAGSAAEACNKWAVSNNQSTIPAGAAIYFYSNTTNGKKYGHVGLAIGGGEVIHVAGPVKRQTIASLCSSGSWCSFRAWGWNGGIPLN